jgi:hypothetical protein
MSTTGRRTFVWSSAIVIALTGAALASTVTSSGVTLTHPNFPITGPALLSCEPSEDPKGNSIKLTGIPENSTVTVTFAWSAPTSGTPTYLPAITQSNVTGGSLSVGVQYPDYTDWWPVIDMQNARAIAIAVMVRISTPDGLSIKLNSKKWWVLCKAKEKPAEGCTPGYWRQDHHYDAWTGYAPGDSFDTVFGVTASFSPATLGNAVALGGGGENALARHAVAALLNAATPNLNYAYSSGEIIAGVQDAYATGEFEAFKDLLDKANNAGCPLN